MGLGPGLRERVPCLMSGGGVGGGGPVQWASVQLAVGNKLKN